MKLILSTGKEIELTREELAEIFGNNKINAIPIMYPLPYSIPCVYPYKITCTNGNTLDSNT